MQRWVKVSPAGECGAYVRASVETALPLDVLPWRRPLPLDVLPWRRPSFGDRRRRRLRACSRGDHPAFGRAPVETALPLDVQAAPPIGRAPVEMALSLDAPLGWRPLKGGSWFAHSPLSRPSRFAHSPLWTLPWRPPSGRGDPPLVIPRRPPSGRGDPPEVIPQWRATDPQSLIERWHQCPARVGV